ncbi:hypothetical protein TELCIR_05612 [Teladorsagia circumcincta]|uniref:RNA-directed DNA polymerase n=1 Tax=Teladorsagia circumcincta TaxID=45464 RepID=A0A2G9UQE5_TELCI|nr:hypothetical protein TELCIR_05612 [Teladorsagia circumcincta]
MTYVVPRQAAEKLLAVVPFQRFLKLEDVFITGVLTEAANVTVSHIGRDRITLDERRPGIHSEIRHLGFIIDKNGRRLDPEKIETIRQMPASRNFAEVRSFQGMISHYGSFAAGMRKMLAPLGDPLKKATLHWTSKCEEGFRRVKEVLTSDLLLTHSDPCLEIIVAADASDYGIGAVVLHRMPDGTEKAICHANRSLTATEGNYGHIEKEGHAFIRCSKVSSLHICMDAD